MSDYDDGVIDVEVEPGHTIEADYSTDGKTVTVSTIFGVEERVKIIASLDATVNLVVKAQFRSDKLQNVRRA